MDILTYPYTFWWTGVINDTRDLIEIANERFPVAGEKEILPANWFVMLIFIVIVGIICYKFFK